MGKKDSGIVGQWALKLLIDRLLALLMGWVTDVIKAQQAKKRAKKKINEIKKETDPVKRAADLDNLFK